MKKNNFYLFGIIVLGIILRLYGLGQRPFDGDEGVMVLIANNSWTDLLARASQDVHPPLYHLILKLFINFGVSEWSVRLISALAGATLVYIVYLFFKKLFAKQKQAETIALVSSLLVAISPYLIYPAQEARMYSLFCLFSLTSYYFFLTLLKKNHWVYWFGYLVFSLAMIYTHYLGFVVIISQVLYLVIFAKESRKEFFRWFLGYLVILLLFLPQINTMFKQFIARAAEQSQAIGLGISFKGLLGAFYRFSAGRWFLDLSSSGIKTLLENPWVFIIFLITLVIPVILLFKGLTVVYKKYRQEFWFLTFPIILAILLCLLSSEIGSKASRYLIYLAPFYLIFVSIGLMAFWQKNLLVIFPILYLMIYFASLAHHYFVEVKAPGENKIAEYVYHHQGDRDIVLIRGAFAGGENWAFNYYYDELSFDIDKSIAVDDIFAQYQAGNLRKLKAIDPLEKAKELLNNYQTIWFYDLTYSNYDFSVLKSKFNINTINLGQDKEDKNLNLIKISEATK